MVLRFAPHQLDRGDLLVVLVVADRDHEILRLVHIHAQEPALPPLPRTLPAPVPATGRGELDGVLDSSSTGAGDVRERRLSKFQQNVARFRLYRLRFCK